MSSPTGRLSRLIMWIGHHYELITVATLLSLSGLMLAQTQPSPSHPTALSYIKNLAVVLAVFAFPWFCKRRHDAQLCQRCAAKFPLSGSARAEAHQRAFRFYHWSLGYLVPLGLVGLAFNLRHQPYLASLALAVMGAWVSASLICARLHHSLSLWCPQCYPSEDSV